MTRDERLLELLKEIELHCPCGARPESLHTHSHVIGCPVEAAIDLVMSATIYPSQAAATAALPKCPRPKGGQTGHWWYIDTKRIGESPDYLCCVCGTCGQKMNLSVDAEDFPAT